MRRRQAKRSQGGRHQDVTKRLEGSHRSVPKVKAKATFLPTVIVAERSGAQCAVCENKECNSGSEAPPRSFFTPSKVFYSKICPTWAGACTARIPSNEKRGKCQGMTANLGERKMLTGLDSLFTEQFPFIWGAMQGSWHLGASAACQ
jgi:hypothetical protein